MSRSRNSTDFVIAYRRARRDYDTRFAPLIAQARAAYSANGATVDDLIGEALEFHARHYVINCILAGLNWRLDYAPGDQLPNLIPESPVRSLARGTTRHLDYLGTEPGHVDTPLMVVEAKRPSSKLPELATGKRATPLDAIVAGLGGETLRGDWNEWLADLVDYAQSIQDRRPGSLKRVAITNGEWFVIFVQPIETFSGVRLDAKGISIFESSDALQERAPELFEILEHQHVLQEVPPLRVPELLFRVSSQHVERMILGVRLLYLELERFFGQELPEITVLPIAFLRTRFGTWFEVQSEEQLHLPRDPQELGVHWGQVQRVSTELQARINRALSRDLIPTSLRQHYLEAERDDVPLTLVGFQRHRGPDISPDRYTILTGDQPHYFKITPTRTGCRHHRLDGGEVGIAGRYPIVQRSIDPRSFFIDGEAQHCAHPDLVQIKSSALSEDNRERCGPRSGRNGDAFCEIYGFDKFLCCRTCVFEDVCTSRSVFVSPCPDAN